MGGGTDSTFREGLLTVGNGRHCGTRTACRMGLCRWESASRRQRPAAESRGREQGEGRAIPSAQTGPAMADNASNAATIPSRMRL